MSQDDVDKITKFAVAVAINTKLRLAASYHITADSITGFRRRRRGRNLVDASLDGAGRPGTPRNRVTGRRGPRHAVSSINPRRIVHFRFRRESWLTRKIWLDTAGRTGSSSGWEEGPTTTGQRLWDGMVPGTFRSAR